MLIMSTIHYNIKTHTTRVPYHPYGGTNMPYVPRVPTAHHTRAELWRTRSPGQTTAERTNKHTVVCDLKWR